MSRGYDHCVRRIGADHYRLSWTFDVKYPDSRLRWPRTITRDTDELGARKFVAKWNVRPLRAADLSVVCLQQAPEKEKPV